MRHRLLVGALLTLATDLAAQQPLPDADVRADTLGDVRAIYIDGHAEAVGQDRKIGSCLMEKFKEQGPFIFPDAKDSADAVLTFQADIPSASRRGLLGRAPKITATLTGVDGAVLWTGENKYKKATTVWGGSTDIECGLANGLVNKLVKAISLDKQRR